MSSEIKWIKIMTDIFDDEKIILIESMPEADTIIVIWFKLLCLAGRLNNNGILIMNERIAYTDEMLTHIFRRPLNTIRLALKTFEQFGMVEIINDAIVIPNWGKHQNVDRMSEIREYNRLAQQRSRERRRLAPGNVEAEKDVNDMSMTSQRSSISISISSSQSKSKDLENENIERENMFNAFYEAYGNKKGKKAANKAFMKISPDNELFQKIMDGVERYHKSRTWLQGFRKEPATWLNGECWNDEYDEESEARRNADHRGNRAGDHSTPRTVYDLKPQFAGHRYDADGNDITDT